MEYSALAWKALALAPASSDFVELSGLSFFEIFAELEVENADRAAKGILPVANNRARCVLAAGNPIGSDRRYERLKPV